MDAQKRIKQLMEERGWTDYRLAKEANLSHSTITNVFKRNNAPTLPTLEVICRAFGITLLCEEWDQVSQRLAGTHLHEQRRSAAGFQTLEREGGGLALVLIGRGPNGKLS